MKTLTELGILNSTDKVVHAYLPHYEKRFVDKRSDPVTLLEIGVWNGESLRMWRDFFPNGKVYGLDVVPEYIFEEDRIKCFLGDQVNVGRLLEVVVETGSLDFVIDDGGHTGTQHVASFRVLWPYIKPGGWYCIEDCFSIYNVCWTQPGDYTMLDLLNDNWKSLFLGESDACEVDIISDGINDGMICIHKRDDVDGKTSLVTGP